MDAECLQTKACKAMLLQPRSEAEKLCEDLKIRVDDLEPRRLYGCRRFECFATTRRLFSSVSGARCPCGKAMDKRFQWIKAENKDIGNGEGIFVKGPNRFIISDDLHITPAFSMEATLSFLEKHGIEDAKALEKKTVDITRKKILKLLKRLMLSTTPLTDIFLLQAGKVKCGNEDQECDQLKGTKQIKLEDNSTAESMSIRVNLLYDKLNEKVVSAQGGEDFVDVIFSFLTFPLGCIVNLLERYSYIGCLDNLYRSTVELLDGSFGIKSEECKNLLLAPKLDTYFSCSNQLLRTEEKASQRCRVHGCETCWKEGIAAPKRTCKHNIDTVVFLTQVNPKLSNSGIECGGGYAKKSVRFMITDDMVVTPLSPASGIDSIKRSKTSFHWLVEKEVVLGEAEVANLLKSCLISRTALTNVFWSRKMEKLLY